MKRTYRTRRARRRLAMVTAAAGVLAVGATLVARDARADAPAPSTAASAVAAAPAGGTARREARGEFDVKIAPLAAPTGEGTTLGRLSLAKTFRGALVATGSGEMLTVNTRVPTSAAYVATELVTGTLDGRRGSFALVHRGTMTKTGRELSISIVPDSGTGELEGIEGTLAIDVREGRHYYVLEYALPAH